MEQVLEEDEHRQAQPPKKKINWKKLKVHNPSLPPQPVKIMD